MKINILITGVNGFIGGSMARGLKGHNLFFLDRSQNKNTDIKGSWIKQDLSKPLDLKLLPTKLDIIIHEAAKVGSRVPDNDQEARRVNIEATKELLDYGKRARITKFIFASTGAVYGYKKEASTEDTKPNPPNYYAKTKLEAEGVVNIHRDFFEVLIFRYFYPYGPGQNRGIQGLVTRILSGEPITSYNQGDNPKTNPIYIDDLVRLTIKSFWLKGSHVINMGGSEIASIKKISGMISKAFGKKATYISQRDTRIKNEIGDITKMTQLIGRPRVSLKEGIRELAKKIQ
jgi:nucleoside-diphosphate-sugar epimerase